MGCCFYFVLTLVLVKNFGDWGLVEIAVHVAKLDLQRGSFLFLFLKFFFTLLFAPFHPLFLPPSSYPYSWYKGACYLQFLVQQRLANVVDFFKLSFSIYSF